MRRRILCLAATCLLPLGAQGRDQNSLGIQGRLSIPGGNLPDAVGTRRPGLGGSLQAELHFEPEFCLRLSLGADDWRSSGSGQLKSVQAYYLGADAVYFLRGSGGGPYLFGGLAGCTWAIGAQARPSGTPLRATKAFVDAGFGYRLDAQWDLELKVLAGQVEPGFTANATTLGVTFRF